MWYAVMVRSGTEEEIRKQCRAVVPTEVLEDCFIPRYESMKRYRGEWHKEKKVLFPGYVFMVSEDVEQLFQKLKQVAGLTKLLGTGDEIVPLAEEEIRLLKDFGNEEQVVKLSKGIIAGAQVIIKEGPLKGYEGCIRKIDRHKRLAYLELEMMGRKVEAQVGVEIVEKRK